MSGTAVTLTLATAVESGDTVTVAYTVPTGESANKLQDASGNAASSGTPRTVLPPAPGAPNSLKVARHESGKLLASWNTLDSGPAPTGYTVQWKESVDDWDDADDVSEAGGADPRSWHYSLELPGPSGNETRSLPAEGVVHSRYSTLPSTPWRGQGPFQSASLTGALLANLEKTLAAEAGAPSGYVLPTPKDGADTTALQASMKRTPPKPSLQRAFRLDSLLGQPTGPRRVRRSGAGFTPALLPSAS